MRLIYLPIIALMTMTAPAFAGTDNGEAPNPFTDPSAGQTTTSGLANGTDSAQIPGVPAVAGGDQQSGRADETKSSGGFYQEQKKEADSH